MALPANVLVVLFFVSLLYYIIAAAVFADFGTEDDADAVPEGHFTTSFAFVIASSILSKHSY